MKRKGVVLVCDRINRQNNIDIYTDNLEFTSEVYFNAIDKALKSTGRDYSLYDSPKQFIDNITKHKNDIVFTAIWSGTLSRNRKALLPSICESYGINYVGADAYVQTICQDKYLTKLFCKDYDIEIPKGILFERMKNFEKVKALNFPLIVKPNNEGSSIGISDENIADTYYDAKNISERLLKKYRQILVEEYIDGKEISICIAGKDSPKICEAIALVIDGNIDFTHQIWGYETKKGGKAIVSRKNITSAITSNIIAEAIKIFSDLGKVDYLRIDGRLFNNKFYLIELTPDCSLHPECFMANAFYSNNINYNGMIDYLLSLYD